MIDIADGELKILESYKGIRGGTYFHLNVNGVLEHLSKYFKGEVVYTGGGNKKDYEYMIPLSDLRRLGEKVEIYEFSFANGGNGPFCTKYEVDCSKKAIKTLGDAKIPEFKIYDEKLWLEKYNAIVPKMVKRVKMIEQELGIKLSISGAALEKIYDNVEKGKKVALTFPPKSRSRTLQRYIQMVHELYTLMLIAKVLDGKTVYCGGYGESTWKIAHAQDNPTAVVELNGKKFTIWYQFSIKKWLDVVRAGFTYPEVIEANNKKEVQWRFPGQEPFLKIGVDDPKKIKLLLGKLPSKPDIVIFEGEYRTREDLSIRLPDKVILIDAKTKIVDSDVRQLEGYKEIFNYEFKKGRIQYIVASLEKVHSEKVKQLRELGFTVVEDVAPGKDGETEFMEIIKKIVN